MKCGMCKGTGKLKMPKDEQVFDYEFERLDSAGVFSLGECREKALEKSGYTIEKCPECNGTGIYMDKKISKLKDKFGIKYFAELGIIDLFGLSLTGDELKERVKFDYNDTYGSNAHSFYNNVDMADIDNIIKEIKEIIRLKSGEEPVVIRFFAIPNFTYLGFDLCPIAKISNNGSTFVFASDKEIFEYFNRINGYYLEIEEI